MTLQDSPGKQLQDDWERMSEVGSSELHCSNFFSSEGSKASILTGVQGRNLVGNGSETTDKTQC